MHIDSRTAGRPCPWVAVAACFAAFGLGACSGPSGGSPSDAGSTADATSATEGGLCVPGLSVVCGGPLGCTGFQVCNPQGTGFDPCLCGTSDGAAADSNAPPLDGSSVVDVSVCVPGLSVACAGPQGCVGFQVCNQSGAAFDPCDCGPPDATSPESAVGVGADSSDAGDDTMGDVYPSSDAPVADAPGVDVLAEANARDSSSGEPGADANAPDASTDSGGNVASNPCGADGGATLIGSYIVSNAADIAALQGYCEVTGDVTIQAAGITNIAFPRLAKIDGSLLMDSRLDAVVLSFPVLSEIGVRLDVAWPATGALGSLSFPALVSVGNLVDVWFTLASTSVDLSALRSVPSFSFMGPSGNVSLPSLVGTTVIIAQNTQTSGATSVTVSAGKLTGGSLTVTFSSPGPNTMDVDLHSFATGALELHDATINTLDLRAFTSQVQAPLFAEYINATGLDYLEFVNTTLPTGFTLDKLTSADAIYLEGVTTQSIGFPRLQTIANVLTITDITLPGTSTFVASRVASIDLPSLAKAGSIVARGTPGLTQLAAPLLTKISGPLDLEDDTGLASVSFPSLASLGGNLRLTGNTQLTTVDLSSLTSLGGSLTLTGNTGLTTVDLPSLTTAGSILARSAGGLTTLNAAQLTTVTGNFDVETNTLLTSFSFPRLTSLGGAYSVYNNPVLPNCMALNLLAQLHSHGYSGQVDPNPPSNNNGAGTCP